MTVTTTGLPAARQSLGRALDSHARPEVPVEEWRAQVWRAVVAVREALVAETGTGSEAWTAAREGGVLRERNAILARVEALASSRAVEHADPEVVLAELRRLLVDVGHHAQRLSDLAYDEVELELGGSE